MEAVKLVDTVPHVMCVSRTPVPWNRREHDLFCRLLDVFTVVHGLIFFLKPSTRE